MNLITDRAEKDVQRWRELRDKGWAGMTADEQAEWMGDPLVAAKAGLPVNIFRLDNTVTTGSRVEQVADSIVATTLSAGTFKYARVVLGPAEDFSNLTLTVSCEDFISENNSDFRIIAYWLDAAGGYDIVSNSALRAPGKVTFNCGRHTREFLSLFIYSATSIARATGTTTVYKKLMVEIGSTAHSYVPYSPIVPTSAVKGMYGHTDMNRVENAVAVLSEKMSALQYPYSPTVKTDWTKEDIPTRDDMLRYFGNIAGIRSVIPVYSTTPVAPSIGNRLTYSMANDIEKILVDIERITDSIPKTWYFAGEINSGEV